MFKRHCDVARYVVTSYGASASVKAVDMLTHLIQLTWTLATW